ncbi:DsbA family protein [Azospirillum sp. B21]|uniref:DsbA family protein n=1 Tax=Azospirillum sp. B21 TaxID=2607496 RepID=UPI0011EF99C5|nr:DsbA family protein [Azospirillum sp. B21]KAA0577778.1 DsbA family protein [Azospirillum sp. B21]
MFASRTLRAAVLFAAPLAAWLVAGAVPAQTPTAVTAAVPATATMPRVLGDPQAPVEVIEYASLTCHHCATFHNTVLPQVKQELVDTGKIRIVYRDFPLDRSGVEAATLARCVTPERYFPLLSVLFAKQDDWSHAKDPVEVLARLGALAGLSRTAYDACRNDQALQDAILQSRLDGERLHGVNSTPSFVIGGKTYKGVLPFEDFKKAVTPLLPAP